AEELLARVESSLALGPGHLDLHPLVLGAVLVLGLVELGQHRAQLGDLALGPSRGVEGELGLEHPVEDVHLLDGVVEHLRVLVEVAGQRARPALLAADPGEVATHAGDVTAPNEAVGRPAPAQEARGVPFARPPTSGPTRRRAVRLQPDRFGGRSSWTS